VMARPIDVSISVFCRWTLVSIGTGVEGLDMTFSFG
jgi:hypothetical protein